LEGRSPKIRPFLTQKKNALVPKSGPTGNSSSSVWISIPPKTHPDKKTHPDNLTGKKSIPELKNGRNIGNVV
jgi:hypothetical protein